MADEDVVDQWDRNLQGDDVAHTARTEIEEQPIPFSQALSLLANTALSSWRWRDAASNTASSGPKSSFPVFFSTAKLE